jgi:hypothetical protein
MSETVHTKLEKSTGEAREQFVSLEENVASALSLMSEQTTAILSKSTEESLLEEERNIQAGKEKLLTGNAESVTSLLASIAPDPLMAKEYDKLTNYSQVVSQTKDIVYVVFQDEKGNNVTDYLNILDDLVNSYIDKGDEDGDVVIVV